MSGKKKIQIRKPDYFERFQCSASDCTDNCCIGWEIDIDERTAERYKKVQGELGQKLKDRILRRGRMNCLILSCRESAVRFSGIIISASLL